MLCECNYGPSDRCPAHSERLLSLFELREQRTRARQGVPREEWLDTLKVYWDDSPSFADTPPAPRDDVILLRALGDETRIVGCKIHDLSAVLDRAGLKLVPKETT